MVKHDWAFLDQILADDYTWTDSDGNVWIRPRNCNLKSGEAVSTAAEADDFKDPHLWRCSGGHLPHTRLKGQSKGKDTSGQFK